ncbi:cytosolic carboxypeptidase Nna1 isoform X4 [Drosophila guanche]|uniref:cytosolic carboxypeptidase Nna1 isoform X4 n=1 Tax=Drosophila guanche TaxID=7266 RepID=UPI0014720A0A|nr:cytosolic carboxypeptidase Nna1 isoform X4 [Drosophila guanche]
MSVWQRKILSIPPHSLGFSVLVNNAATASAKRHKQESPPTDRPTSRNLENNTKFQIEIEIETKYRVNRNQKSRKSNPKPKQKDKFESKRFLDLHLSEFGYSRIKFETKEQYPPPPPPPHHHQLECDLFAGFLGSFLSKGLKTNQLVVNTDEKTLRPVARLKEPRDLFALPKDKDNDCSQQAPRWPVECQVIEERITHIPYVPAQPEPLNAPTGNELKPRPVGEENGIVVFSYSPISAVNYAKPRAKKEDESSDESDYSSDSRNDSTPPSRSTPVRQPAGSRGGKLNSVSKMINSLDNRSTSASLDDDVDYDDEYDYDTSGAGCGFSGEAREKAIIKDLIEEKKRRYMNAAASAEEKQQQQQQPTAGASAGHNSQTASRSESKPKSTSTEKSNAISEIDDIWKNNTSEYKPASPRYILSQFGKNVTKAMIDRLVDQGDDKHPTTGTAGGNQKVASSSKYAISPIKLPKKNIARLEVAFERSARPVSPNSNIVTNSETKQSSDSDKESTTESVDTTSWHSCRLSGGADTMPLSPAGSETVSETETLVGEESKSEIRLASVGQQSRIKYPRARNCTVPYTHAQTLAAAANRVARAHRNAEPRLMGEGRTGTGTGTGTSTGTTTSNLNACSPSIDSSFQSQESTTNQETNTSSQSFLSSSNPLPQEQFSRSAVGGAKFVTNCHPMNPEEYDGLEFESRFESGNLAKAVQITPTYYELYLRPDLYTSRSKQWFYFRVRRTRRKMLYRFSIVNLVKSDSLYNDGMQPVMYSTLGAKEKSQGWRRCGDNICYYRNDDERSTSNNANEEDEDNSTYTLTFTIEFEHDEDAVYFAHSYPYTYSDLQDYLMEIQRHPVKSKFCKLRLLCRTLAGNNVYYLTVTAPSSNEENMRRKKSIVVSARVHPSETPASWMMKGLMDFITGDTTVAKRLRHKFIFKLVPMLNPDGVIVGNTRNSLTGKDLNRQYRTVIRETYPSIWYTKAMIRRLIEECGVAMYCDMHAHSRKHNIFIYGCENKRNPEKKLTEQVFPLMLHKNSADRFSFESCKFKIQRSKEGTGRIVVWMLGITNSYTIEASFGGSSLGSRKGTHFNTQDYEHMGRAFCETLLDYCDENPNKVKRHAKLFKQIKKIRKREKREQKALKLQKMADQDRLRSKIIERLMREGSSADEPLNIPLSDYSSDEGNCSSSSDNEGKHSITASDLEGPCCAPTRAPPSSPEVIHEIRKFRLRRMRKVMHELDRIYFTPMFQRKFKAINTLKRRRHKLGATKTPSTVVVKRLKGGGGGPEGSNTTANVASMAEQRKKPVEKDSADSSGSSSQSQENDSAETTKKPAARGTRSTASSSQASGASKQRAKKKKCLPTETKKKPQANHKLHVNRNFRLWLANRKIFICRRRKSMQTRRTRVRNKAPKKRGEVVRTTLDLPTTDPGSDLHFSTDDEEHSPTIGPSGYGAVAPLRHTLLQSELQRRYIEEIGDTVVQKPKPAYMPPELIVTTPSKSNTPGGGAKLDFYKLTPRTAPELDGGAQRGMYKQQGGSLGGATSTSARRTYSWHNLDQEAAAISSSKQAAASFYMHESKAAMKIKPPPRRHVPSNFIPQRNVTNTSSADDLQLKLSLKKKIWTGAHGEPDGRPLSWFKGHMNQTHQSQAQVQAQTNAMASAASAIRSAGGGGGGGGGGGTASRTVFTAASGKEATAGVATGAPAAAAPPTRKPRKLEQVDLFTACSQKLIMWQQQEEHKKMQPQRLIRVEEQQREMMRSFKPMQLGKKQSLMGRTMAGLGPDASSAGLKVKRKSSSMMKIAETTQLVTRFARTRGSSGSSALQQQQQQQQQMQLQQQQHASQGQRMMYKNQSMANSGSGRHYSAGMINPQHGHRGPSKFKTGGLVVTAVQQPGMAPGSSNSSRRMRNAAGLPVKASQGHTALGAAANGSISSGNGNGLLQYQRNSAANTQISKSSTTGISLDTVNLVRKVKTKLKKRKSRALTNGAAK